MIAAQTPVPTLAAQLRRLRHGDHHCLVYDSPEEQFAALVPFIADGLARHEACVYFADDRTVAEVREALERGGIDVDGAVARGQLTFLTKREAYLRTGAFDPPEMLEFLRGLLEKATAAGYSGMRVTGEMTWALGGEPGCERHIEYEALLNDFLPGTRALAICQYSRRRFAPRTVRDVLRTHPVAILGDQVCPNLYYEPPKLVLGEGDENDRVDWMIAQLRRFRFAEEQLEYAVQMRDEFLSVASHELNTPLTSLKLQLQQLARRGDTGPERFAKAVDLTTRQVERLERLVGDLLDVTRVQSGRMTLERAPLELGEVARSVVERLCLQADRAHTPVSLDIEGEVSGRWDRSRIEQVLVNLLGNALKYAESSPITVQVKRNAVEAKVSVVDRGPGIAPAHRQRIFERFDRGTARGSGGLGLGLFIASEIVGAHGGRLHVEETPGGGATFVMSLPAEAA